MNKFVKIGVIVASYLLVLGIGALLGAMGHATSTIPTPTAVAPTVQVTVAHTTPTTALKTATPKPPPAHGWVVLQSFTGKGGEMTQPFDVSAQSWRMVWSCSGFSDTNIAGSFAVNVHTPDGNVVDSSIVTSNCPGEGAPLTGTSYVYSSGRFYLEIISAGDGWTLKVEVQQ